MARRKWRVARDGVTADADGAPSGSGVAAASGGGGEVSEGDAGGEKLSMLARLRVNVLSRPDIWVLAFSFLGVYLLRQALTSWLVFYLIEAREKRLIAEGRVGDRTRATRETAHRRRTNGRSSRARDTWDQTREL